jgi:hypothetical protein
MVTIVKEHGIDPSNRLQKYKGFKCKLPAIDCCCRCILFNQPDFASVGSALEIPFKDHEFRLFFLPKFHCELNMIEQCWRYAKHIYCYSPELSYEDHLEQNALSALASVSETSIQKFFNRSAQFVEAYSRGLKGTRDAWATKTYESHRMPPTPEMIQHIMEEVPILNKI